ncbi:BC1872 family protein [Priestia megaterium]|uniref:BC1872 family protein n=1 Tax=Priestia megaterium TaxID=1404 RepID=UPI003CC502EE
MADQLVATKVMGWDLDERVGLRQDNCLVIKRNDTSIGGIFHSEKFQPTTNIQDAWLVVEKLRNEKDYWFELTTPDSFSLKYKCYFQLDDMEAEAIDDSAPLAISLAALRTEGIKI